MAKREASVEGGSSKPQHKKARLQLQQPLPVIGDKLLSLLCRTSSNEMVATPPKGRGIVTIFRKEKIQDAFRKLVDHNVLSAPVLCENSKLHGFLDVLDLTHYISKLFTSPLVTQDDVQALFDKEDAYKEATVKEIKVRPANAVLQGFSLFHFFELMARTGVHRVSIVDSNKGVVNIITQSMLIKFLLDHVELLGEAQDTYVAEILKHLPENPLITVNATDLARTAFGKIVEHRVGGVAVVDEKTGHLVDALSTRDLRGIRTDAASFWRLWDTVKNFKEKVRSDYPDMAPSKMLTVLSSHKLKDVLSLLVKHKIHRVFVVKSQEEPIPYAVISQNDILAFVLRLLLPTTKPASSASS